MTTILAMFNQKGGVGKTTTGYHLARAAVVDGLRVLVVDLDPQGNLTQVLGDDVPDDQVGVADALSSRAPETLEDVIVPSIWPGVDLAPTVGETLAAVRNELVATDVGRESRLASQVKALPERWDLIIIDIGPAVDALAINGLVAADTVCVVTEPRMMSLNGLSRMLETIALVRQHYQPKLSIGGVVVNHYRAGTRGADHWLGELTDAMAAHQLPVLEPIIAERVAIADALEAGLGLDQWPGAGEHAAAYTHILKQLTEGASK